MLQRTTYALATVLALALSTAGAKPPTAPASAASSIPPRGRRTAGGAVGRARPLHQQVGCGRPFAGPHRHRNCANGRVSEVPRWRV